MKKPTFHEIYKTDQKFHCDPYGIWMFSGPEGDCSLTALDNPEDFNGDVLISLCNFLNGDIPCFQPEVEKVEHEYIYLKACAEHQQVVFRVRGTGYIASRMKKWGLQIEDINRIQDEFAQWIADKIKKSQKDV